MASVLHINKGINRSIEFRGLKAQYIWYFAAGVLVLLVLFAILYITGVNSFICIALILGLGTLMTIKLYAMSGKYGEHGLMKKLASKRVPRVIKSYSRNVFTGLIAGDGQNRY
jgi:hypothetical protein